MSSNQNKELIESATVIAFFAIISIIGILYTGVFFGTFLLSEGILAITVLVILWYALETARMKAELAVQNKYLQKSNLRAEKLFEGQNKPLIDITPITLTQIKGGTHVVIKFSIFNYSGFNALNVGFDVKYGKNVWIGEWLKASNHSGGVRLEEPYNSFPKTTTIPILESGQTKIISGESSGSLNLENDVCKANNGEIPIQIRVRWENENHHVFDEIHEYKLICTKVEKNDGRSFTFIPVGVISKKG